MKFCSLTISVMSWILSLAQENVIMEDLLRRQNPPVIECGSRKLMVYHDKKSDFFEGTGSIIKTLTIALAEAYHSDRILVWGNFVPPFYARAQNASCYNRRQGVYNKLSFKAFLSL